jgi:hypothetical protein
MYLFEINLLLFTHNQTFILKHEFSTIYLHNYVMTFLYRLYLAIR